MTTIKTVLLDLTPQLLSLWTKYDFPAEALKKWADELETFSVRLPLVGSFSAGKSTLLNNLLGERIFAVAIDPATCLAAEIRYAQEANYVLHHPNNGEVVLCGDALKAQQFGDLAPGSWVEVLQPSERLAQLPGMTLVDMPGWESGIDQHAKAIDQYLHRSCAYCIVVSVDEGGLKNSLRNIIEELAVQQKPMMLVITKADKKPAEDVQKVAMQVADTIQAIIQQPLLSVSITSRRDVEEWFRALQALLPLQQRFVFDRCGTVAVGALQQLQQRIDLLCNEENLSLADIQHQFAQLREQGVSLISQLEEKKAKILAQVDPIASEIELEFTSQLKGQLDTLVNALLNQGDVQGVVGSSLRIAYTKGMERKLKPLVQREFSSFNTLSKGGVETQAFNASFAASEVDPGKFDNMLGQLLPIAVAALTRIPVLMVFAPLIKSVLEAVFSSSAKELAKREQREQARRYVLDDLIPRFVGEVSGTIRQSLQSNLQEVIKTVEEHFKSDIKTQQQSLTQLEAQLGQAKEADELCRLGYQQDLAQVQQMLQQLGAFAHDA